MSILRPMVYRTERKVIRYNGLELLAKLPPQTINELALGLGLRQSADR